MPSHGQDIPMQATVYANLTTRRLTTTLGGSAISFPAFVQGDKVRIGLRFAESLEGSITERQPECLSGTRTSKSFSLRDEEPLKVLMAVHQPIRVSPVTWSKWVSRLITGSLCWRAMAAIHRSFIGMGVPADAS